MESLPRAGRKLRVRRGLYFPAASGRAALGQIRAASKGSVMSTEPECLPEPAADVWPVGKKAALFTLFLSVLFAVLDFMDRQVLAGLFPYLKAEYRLTDTQLGMLAAIVNVSIALLTIPSGYLVDRWSRSKMMGLLTFVWSVATGACAFAGSYAHLLVGRFFVGAGEAGYSPAAQSLLAASFPSRLRSTVLSIYLFGTQVGGPLGLVIGAFIASHWGWRHAFGLVALPGILAAGLCVFIKDFKNVKPACDIDGEPVPGTRRSSWLHTVVALLRTPSLALVFLAQATTAMCLATLMNWLPTYFGRAAGMTPTLASSISAVLLLAASFSTLVGGPFLDWLRKKASVRAIRWQAIACFIAFGLEALAFSVAKPGGLGQVVLLMAASPFFATVLGLGYTLTADLSLPQQRGVAASLMVMTQNILGMAVGPLLTGTLSDHFDIGTSLLCMTGCFAVSGLIYVCISFTYNRDVARMDKVVVEF